MALVKTILGYFKHAWKHAAAGEDPISPSDIGAAALDHVHSYTIDQLLQYNQASLQGVLPLPEFDNFIMDCFNFAHRINMRYTVATTGLNNINRAFDPEEKNSAYFNDGATTGTVTLSGFTDFYGATTDVLMFKNAANLPSRIKIEYYDQIAGIWRTKVDDAAPQYTAVSTVYGIWYTWKHNSTLSYSQRANQYKCTLTLPVASVYPTDGIHRWKIFNIQFSAAWPVISQGGAVTLDLSIAEGKNIPLGTATGTKIGTASNQKLGFHGATPTVQRASAAQAAVVATAATNVSPFGYSTQAQADGVVILLNEIRAALVEKGIIKGSA